MCEKMSALWFCALILMLMTNVNAISNGTSKSDVDLDVPHTASNDKLKPSGIKVRGWETIMTNKSTPSHSFRLEFSHQDMDNGPLNITKMRLLMERSEKRRHQIVLAFRLPPSLPPTFRTSIVSGEGAFLTTSPTTGTPGIGFTALIDTGSDLIWRQCEPCQHCFDEAPGSHIFDPSRSSTFRHVSCYASQCTSLPHSTCTSYSSCSYIYTYGDNSYTAGDLVSDTITMPDATGQLVSVPGVVFGCGHDNENSDFAGADGLIGLGQGPLSLLSQLRIPRFSYCLQSITDPPYRTSPLFLGGGATLTGLVQSTPLIIDQTSRTFY